MTKLIIAGGRLVVVTRSADEDGEQYWDRAWCFAVAASSRGSDLGACWLTSLKRPHERRGSVYGLPPQ